MIKLTDRAPDMVQDRAIPYWNNKKLPYASLELVGKLVEQGNDKAVEQVRSDCMGFNYFLSSTRTIYNTNNLGGKVIHNFGSKYARQTTIALKEIPDYTDEPLPNVLATKAGFAYVRALFNLPKANAARMTAILEKLSNKAEKRIYFWTPSQSQRQSRPQRAVRLFYDVEGFRVDGYVWFGGDGLSRGVLSGESPAKQGMPSKLLYKKAVFDFEEKTVTLPMTGKFLSLAKSKAKRGKVSIAGWSFKAKLR